MKVKIITYDCKKDLEEVINDFMNMKGYDILLRSDDGSILKTNTNMIEEDVIRHRFGLEDKKTKEVYSKYEQEN